MKSKHVGGPFRKGNCVGETHGFSKTQTYAVWQGMRARCDNSNHKDYARYGGRGIKVCKRWLKFENFLLDMGVRPPKLTLDRVNNNKGYTPNNCRWATQQEQMRNSTRANYITFMGVTKTIGDWERGLGLSQGQIYYRTKKAGWTMADALSTPKLGRSEARLYKHPGTQHIVRALPDSPLYYSAFLALGA